MAALTEHKNVSSIAVKGSLKSKCLWWNNNVSNNYVLNIINNGYEIPLTSIPPRSVITNNKSARDHPKFVAAEIQKLLDSGIVNKCTSVPHIVNPLTVAENTVGKLRLVLDLRTVNPLVYMPKYKFEDIRSASNYFSKNCYMVNFDLKSGYHHIDVHPAFHQYLGFCWEGQCYTFSVLAFGLRSAGYVFTKVLKELVKRWRALAIPIVLYLDDGLIVASSAKLAEHFAHIVKTDLLNAGFVINEAKSCWSPRQRVEWLGFKLLSDDNIFEVPKEKMFRVQCLLFKTLLCRHSCSARMLAKIVGNITCLFHALGNIVYLMSKNAQCWIAERDTWGERSSLPEAVLIEIRFWHEHVGSVRRMPLEKQLTFVSKIIYSDASATGCGAFIKNCEGTALVHYWSPEERTLSSTWRELKTVEIFMGEKLDMLSGLGIKWYTDNKAVPRVIYKGSMVENLQHSALKIFTMCIENNIDLSIDWIPRSSNEQADELSKIQDVDDWQIQQHIFNFLNKVLGPCTIDCFATNLSAKVSRFYAKYCCEGVTGIDAFAFSWANEFVWMVPPPKLIPKVISHCKLFRVKGILIIPKWTSAVYWPLVKNGEVWLPGLTLKYEYQNPVNFFKRGAFGNSCFTEGRFASNVVVLGVNFQDI
jgi:hypothetical protein